MGEYFGSNGYISGLGFRLAGERPVTFSKSILNEGEYYYDENGIRHRKRGVTELQDIDVEEVSYVDIPATRQKFMIIKGDDKEMDRCEWASVQNCVFGFCESDLAMVSESDIYEIEKSDPTDKFPSLTKQFNLNKAILERRYEERELESRAI